MIWIRGEPVLLDVGAVPHDPKHLGGFEFTPMNTRVKQRTAEPDLIVLHDTAGENSAESTYRMLLKKQLSVHFCVDRDGCVWQFCDPAFFSCMHVGRGVNSRSIGIEVTNAVVPRTRNPWKWMMGKFRVAQEKRRGRPVVEDTYRGKPRKVLGHLPRQRFAVRCLVRVLLDAFETIPPTYPGYPLRVTGARLVPELEYRGVTAHLHHTDAHVDPALDLFEDLREELR